MIPEAGGPRPLAATALHLGLTLLLFADVAFAGRLPYFRDVGVYYYPNYVFTAASLGRGLWPLWNPAADAGAPFLIAYPVELVLLALAGARFTLAIGPPLHVFAAMCGATCLSRELGASRWGATFAGAAFGLSGFLLSSLNLHELSHGAALAPWVIAAYLRCVRSPSGPRAAALAALAALQLSTLSAESVLQTALAALVLTPLRPRAPSLRALGAAALTAALLSAPVVLGAFALVRDTARGAGFAPGVALAWSAHPVVLAEAVWPFLLGDPHTMTNLGYIGQPYFPDGYPYILSLYVGAAVVGLAACAGRARARLWMLCALGVLVAFGAYGPLGRLQVAVLPNLRVPAKALLLSTLAIVLLAAHGLDRALGDRSRGAALLVGVPAGLLLAVGAALGLFPAAASGAAAAVWPSLARPEAAPILAVVWPAALFRTGLLGLAAAAALLLRTERRAALACACILADLLVTNAAVEPSAPPDFYALQPEVAALVARGRTTAPGRWFSFGAESASPAIHWSRELLVRNRDLPLYALDRQLLYARFGVLDGVDGVFDENRTGWAPSGSTLDASLSRPARYREVHQRFRRAGVRWVLSLVPLPEDLVTPGGRARVPYVAEPLLLYEIASALPQAYWVPDCELVTPLALRARLEDPSFDPTRVVLLTAPPPGGGCGLAAPAGEGRVTMQRVSPHELRVSASAAGGFAVVLEGFNRDWGATGDGRPVPILHANDRYWAIPLGQGRVELTVRFRPPWRLPALVALGLGGACALILLLSRRLRLTQAPATC
jgi:hypothetical protein